MLCVKRKDYIERSTYVNVYLYYALVKKLIMEKVKHALYFNISVVLSTHSHDPCLWGLSDLPACGPPASFFVHLASSAITPAVSIYKSRGARVVRMWVQLKR